MTNHQTPNDHLGELLTRCQAWLVAYISYVFRCMERGEAWLAFDDWLTQQQQEQ